MKHTSKKDEMRATVITHGCRSNLAEQDLLARLAPSGTTVINSCAVTAEAVRDARAAARKSGGKVFMTGCAAAVAPERFSDLDVKIIPNLEKLRPKTWGREGPNVLASTRLSRGFLAIQDGCDHHCTFCVTRLARGPSRSVPIKQLLEEARRMVDAGTNELVLTGIDATSYGSDLEDGISLGRLAQKLLSEIAGLKRLRMSSLDAAEADEALLDAFSDSRMMPHVHLSLQSGDDLILKRMRRRHGRQDAIDLVVNLKKRRPDIAIGADLIAGFPTESEEAHENSCALLDACDIVHAHIFPFSPRPGTAAARMPQLRHEVRKIRAARLRLLAEQRKEKFLAGFVGQRIEVVSEGRAGLSPHGVRVRLKTPQTRGAVVPVIIASASKGELSE